jgi:DNA (cytosine-5)-methyltransferase 1
MADSYGRNASAEREQRGGEQRQQPQDGGAGSVADTASSGRREECADGGRIIAGDRAQGIAARLEHGGSDCGLADADGRKHGAIGSRTDQRGLSAGDGRGVEEQSRPGPTNGQWGVADWLYCMDGKWRPVEPGTFPLAHGVSGRVGRLRAYGNAIVPAQAAEFICAYTEAAGLILGDLERAA